jgi:hypothetical protein
METSDFAPAKRHSFAASLRLLLVELASLVSSSTSRRSGVSGLGGNVDGHQDLPSDGHEVDPTAITESNRICWSSRRGICSERRLFASTVQTLRTAVRAQIVLIFATSGRVVSECVEGRWLIPET